MTDALTLPNGGAVPLSKVPKLAEPEFRESILQGVENGERIAALFGCPAGDSVRLFALLACKDTGLLSVVSTDVRDSYPALTPDCPQAHMFEREIAEQWRIEPVGHPWLKPVRFQQPLRTGRDVLAGQSGSGACGVTNFFQIEGEEIHEVAVGPVHAGIIEPGHFRFQCHGETVHHLEISLGYQHRGVEKALLGGPDKRTIHYMETLAGDTTVGHAMAYCRAVEALSKLRVPARAQVLRGIALELERIANHIGDLGALAGDIGFLPTMSFCGRIRGDVLNLTAVLCGNRFGRGLVRPGGVGFDVDKTMLSTIRIRLEAAIRDATSAINLLWDTPSVMSRFEGTGIVSREICEEIGMVGVAARACGVERDVRQDFPYGIYRLSQIPVITWNSGDVFARAFVRWQEIQRSAAFVLEQLDAVPESATAAPSVKKIAARHMAVALVEGWRGEICHVAITNESGQFAEYKVVDPSFHNWFGLALAMRNQQISDFPLCNKSFNLSYCGHDL
jgi:Ni,Fe-hydrogenase III large subunit